MFGTPALDFDSAVGLETEGLLSDGGGLVLSAIDTSVSGDDGGWEIIASGEFPLGVDIGCEVWTDADHVRCYSGVAGQGDVIRTLDGATISFVLPPLPVGGPYTVSVVRLDTAETAELADAITVIHRSFTDRLYTLRAQWPPPRDVGPYDIRDEA